MQHSRANSAQALTIAGVTWGILLLLSLLGYWGTPDPADYEGASAVSAGFQGLGYLLQAGIALIPLVLTMSAFGLTRLRWPWAWALGMTMCLLLALTGAGLLLLGLFTGGIAVLPLVMFAILISVPCYVIATYELASWFRQAPAGG
jgi:hypothetical protein